MASGPTAKLSGGFGDYAKLAGELVREQGVRYFDLTNYVADQYQEVGPEKVKTLFGRDTTHTNRAGADINAQAVIAGIKALDEYALVNAMTSAGPVPSKLARPNTPPLPSLPCLRGAAPEVFNCWLNLPEVPDTKLPAIFLIGDSTVRNGRGDGVDRQWGWGDAFAVYIDRRRPTSSIAPLAAPRPQALCVAAGRPFATCSNRVTSCSCNSARTPKARLPSLKTCTNMSPKSKPNRRLPSSARLSLAMVGLPTNCAATTRMSNGPRGRW